MKDNENNRGYIIFNADGTKPNCMLAALKNDDSVAIVIEGKTSDLLSMFGSIARSIVAKCGVPKDILCSAVTTAVQVGDAWEGIMAMMGKEPSDETVDKILDMFRQE